MRLLARHYELYEAYVLGDAQVSGDRLGRERTKLGTAVAVFKSPWLRSDRRPFKLTRQLTMKLER